MDESGLYSFTFIMSMIMVKDDLLDEITFTGPYFAMAKIHARS
jgi:hypothetical protein